ncbi:MAG: transketolase, partial [Bacillota bacterium]|nr:transketolase [Bacillota bacterium]
LGQGASLAAGIALGMKLKNINRYAYLVLGDGECDEGQVWEMALFANNYKLNNLIAFIDCNHQQLDGYTDDICPLGNLEKKFEDFGWNTEKVNGHNIEEIYDAICRAKEETNRPSMIVLYTVKGKGWSATEGKTNIHHIKISQQQMKEAEKEICARIEKQKLSIKE